MPREIRWGAVAVQDGGEFARAKKTTGGLDRRRAVATVSRPPERGNLVFGARSLAFWVASKVSV